MAAHRDIGYVEDGRVYLVDRAKDIIKVNGWTVSPAELEAVLYHMPDIKDDTGAQLRPGDR